MALETGESEQTRQPGSLKTLHLPGEKVGIKVDAPLMGDIADRR